MQLRSKYSSQFGAADVIVREDWQSDISPEVIRISNMRDYFGDVIGGLGAGELDWHTDQSYVVAPATGSILYMVEMPSPAPQTYWAKPNTGLTHLLCLSPIQKSWHMTQSPK